MIERVGATAAEANTITIPGVYQAGDTMLIFAFRDGSATNPTIPAGWTTITNTFDGTTCSVSIGYKVAASNVETSGTWTNATALICHVYRGCKVTGSPFGTPTNTAGTTSPSTYGAVTLRANTSWLIAFQGHRSVDTTTLTNPPSGMVNVSSSLGATCDMAGFDTNGNYDATGYLSNTVAPGGTASGWQTTVIELKPIELQMENFKAIRSASGWVGERWR
jgi:hypothetical protein